MAYVEYTCFILHGIILHLDGYVTRFGDAMLCNDDHNIQNANMVRLRDMPSKLGFWRRRGPSKV